MHAINNSDDVEKKTYWKPACAAICPPSIGPIIFPKTETIDYTQIFVPLHGLVYVVLVEFVRKVIILLVRYLIKIEELIVAKLRLQMLAE